MTNRIDIVIPGEPIPQPRMTPVPVRDRKGNIVVNRKTGRPVIRMVTPKSKRADESGGIRGWKTLVAIKLREALPWPRSPWDGPVELDVTFYFDRTEELKRPKHSSRELLHAVKPDLDNLVKAIKDVMTDVGIWTDDGRVSDCVTRKRYCARDFGPGVRVIARLIAPDTESLYDSAAKSV